MSRSRNLLRVLPGIAVSGFFLWLTFRKVSLHTLMAVKFVNRGWFAVMAVFLVCGYLLRIHRWWSMLRSSSRPRFSQCARVLLTSFAANNILPFRIGDLMRVFTYADDLGTSSSIILSTVILERLLDIFTLFLFFAATMWRGSHLPYPHVRLTAVLMLGAAGTALLVLILGANTLEEPVRRLMAKLPQSPKVVKLEHWLLLALEAIRKIGLVRMMLLLGESVLVWTCEGMIFVSAAKLLGLRAEIVASWQALALCNLSFLIPSSPGSIGPFEYAANVVMTGFGENPTVATLYGTLVHLVVLVSVTGAGGIFFLVHRYHMSTRKPLLKEIETLPQEIQ